MVARSNNRRGLPARAYLHDLADQKRLVEAKMRDRTDEEWWVVVSGILMVLMLGLGIAVGWSIWG